MVQSLSEHERRFWMGTLRFTNTAGEAGRKFLEIGWSDCLFSFGFLKHEHEGVLKTEGALQQIGTKEDSMAKRTDSFFRGVGSQTGERPETEHALAEDWRPAPAEDHPSGPSVLLTHRYFKISL